jgi:glycosyltransferase involved in cell wall biosynthesis
MSNQIRRISVVVCTYNRADKLRNVLYDLDRLTIPQGVSCEVVVVDNNSQDDTPAVVEEFVKKRRGFFRYMFQPWPGKSRALNTGISVAQGDVIAFTDDDVCVDSEWLVEIKRAFELYDCIGIGGKIVPVWNCEKPQWLEEDGPYGLYAAIVRMDLGNEVVELRSPAFGANMAFRRTAINRFGSFRENLGPNPDNLIRNEDSEFCNRVMSAGEKIMYVPKAVVYHPVDEQRVKKQYFQKWYFDYGRSLARRAQPKKNAVGYLGVPRYLIRMLVEQTIRWVFSVSPRRRFFYKLQGYQIAGEIAEFYAYQKDRDRKHGQDEATMKNAVARPDGPRLSTKPPGQKAYATKDVDRAAS